MKSYFADRMAAASPAHGWVFFDDMILRKTNVRDFLPKMKIPFHWLLGDVEVYGETGPVEYLSNPKFIEEFVSLNPLATFEHMKKAGELMPYQQPRLVAQRLAGVSRPDARQASKKCSAFHDPPGPGALQGAALV